LCCKRGERNDDEKRRWERITVRRMVTGTRAAGTGRLSILICAKAPSGVRRKARRAHAAHSEARAGSVGSGGSEVKARSKNGKLLCSRSCNQRRRRSKCMYMHRVAYDAHLWGGDGMRSAQKSFLREGAEGRKGGGGVHARVGKPPFDKPLSSFATFRTTSQPHAPFAEGPSRCSSCSSFALLFHRLASRTKARAGTAIASFFPSPPAVVDDREQRPSSALATTLRLGPSA
jgi:hypothetical protein